MIPNFLSVLSLTVSETFFSEKMAKLPFLANFKNYKIFKVYGALTFYDPCDPKFSFVLLYLIPFLRKYFFSKKMAKVAFGANLEEN